MLEEQYATTKARVDRSKFHYDVSPLLVVETSQFDSEGSEQALDDLVKQIRGMGAGTRYYVPRTK